MRIGFFVTEFPLYDPETNSIRYLDGGVGMVAFNLAKNLAKRGNNIFIFTSSYDSKNIVESYENIRIFRYKKKFVIGQAPISINLLYEPLFSGISLDVVHTHMGNFPAPISAYLYAKSKKIPLITTYHNDAIGGFGSLTRRLGVFLTNSLFCKMILKSSEKIIAFSEQNINESLHLSYYSEKIAIIPNGIDFQKYRTSLSRDECRKKLGLPLDKKIILFLGAQIPIKGPQILLPAMKKIIREYPECYLILAGDGKSRNELQAKSISLGLENNIDFTGFVSNGTKIMYYKSADIFVLPSLHEAFALVLLEASICGLPLVVSGLDSLSCIIEDGYNGLLTRPGDPLDLAEKIIFLLKNDDLRLNLGENARKWIEQNEERFSWKRIAEKTELLYQDFV